jgi:hypothetical protein
LEALRGDGDTDVDCSRCGSGGFIAISVGVELGSESPVNVELDTSEVGCFRCSVFSEVGAFFDEERSAFLACDFPAFTEPLMSAAPVVESIVVWQFRMLA